MGAEKITSMTRLQDALHNGTTTLIAVAPTLPREADIESELEDARRAAARGYFLPDEDERARAAFARYLRARAALLQTIEDLRPHVRKNGDENLPAFAVALAAACMLVRSARYLVRLCEEHPTIAKKLDEPDQNSGIPRKAFTQIYQSLARPANLYRFFQALRYARDHEAEIAALAADPLIAPIIQILKEERPHAAAIRKRILVNHRLRYWTHSLRRRRRATLSNVLFALFEVSGRAVAEMRLGKPKQVTPAIRESARSLLRPGDVLVTRHHDAMSNLFLPGFWPHAALYLGDEEHEVLEAKKDGVKFRKLEETLSVDAFTIIRPKLSSQDLTTALARARTHVGKLYDFEFDFRRADRLVCTEVIYRTYHGIGGIHFTPAQRAGRVCLTAEQLLDHALAHHGFEPIAIFGSPGVSELLHPPGTSKALKKSYAPATS